MGASVEVDIGGLAPGEVRTVEWRGKPVWILRRTPEMLAGLAGLDDQLADPKSLRDQQPEYARNTHRSINEEVLVTVGICTHLGCSPNVVPAGTANPSVGSDWAGGFFCPCHGSTFDLAGRVFKNKPAPTNLEIPPHKYVSATKLLVGEDGLA
jgi:ubiquinol-cytochrome c reductase iron-sulfur subunit